MTPKEKIQKLGGQIKIGDVNVEKQKEFWNLEIHIMHNTYTHKNKLNNNFYLSFITVNKLVTVMPPP